MKLRGIRQFFPVGEEFNVYFLWTTGSFIILGISGIIINIWIARFRGAEALGIFNQVFAFYIFVSQICTFGIHLSVLKYISENSNNLSICSDIATTALLLVAGIASIICIICWTGKEAFGALLNSDGVASGLKFAIPGLFFFAMNKIGLNVLNGLQRMRAYAIFQSLRYILILIGVICVISLQLRSYTLAVSLTLAEVVLFMVMYVYTNLRIFPLKFQVRNKEWFREHVYFGVKGFLSGVLSDSNTRIDVLMLGYFRNDITVGIYSFAAILAEGTNQLCFIMRRNVAPIIGMHFAGGEKDKISDFSKEVRRAFFKIMGIVGLIAVVVYPLCIHVIVGKEEFSVSWMVFIVLMVGIVVSSGYRSFRDIILLGGMPGFQSILIIVILILNVALNAFLIPIFGIYGAAIATSFAYVFEAFLIRAVCYKVLDVIL
jgi:O-antigen/teichoic acid export membrane protein